MQSKHLPEAAIRYDLTVKGMNITFLYIMGVCPSHHSPNDMTPLSIE